MVLPSPSISELTCESDIGGVANGESGLTERLEWNDLVLGINGRGGIADPAREGLEVTRRRSVEGGRERRGV